MKWWPIKKTQALSDEPASPKKEERDSEVLTMVEIIAELKKEKERYEKAWIETRSQLVKLRTEIAKNHGRTEIDYFSGGLANKVINYLTEEKDGYFCFIADHDERLTMSFNREFDKSKGNHNWVNEGEALITIHYDNVNRIYGCNTTIKAPVSGIFETINNKLINKGEVFCRIKIIDPKLKAQTIEALERESIKQAVLQRERKKMIERETMDELIAEGKVFNVITKKDGNRMTIPMDIANAVWNRDGGQCCMCGAKTELEFDHIIPISKGGATTFRNLQLLCKSCNIKKSDNI